MTKKRRGGTAPTQERPSTPQPSRYSHQHDHCHDLRCCCVLYVLVRFGPVQPGSVPNNRDATQQDKTRQDISIVPRTPSPERPVQDVGGCAVAHGGGGGLWLDKTANPWFCRRNAASLLDFASLFRPMRSLLRGDRIPFFRTQVGDIRS